jgi:iron complex transport system permease protein
LKNKFKYQLSGLIILTTCLFFIDIWLGSIKIPFNEFRDTLLHGKPTDPFYLTIFAFRIPKALVALFAGAALAVSGLQMQTLFRNPLAGPYLLGVSSGASLGVAIVLMGLGSSAIITLNPFLSQWIIVIAAWLGAAAILLAILLVSIRVRDIMTILVFGIMFGSAASALINVLQYAGSSSSVKTFVIWTMGSLGSVTMDQLRIFIPGIIIGIFIAFILTKSLNALLLGEQYARTMGLNIRKTRTLVFASTSLLAGTVTAFCGPIGFIGIVVPHICRMYFQTSNHRILVPTSLLMGSSLLLFSDIISQLPGHQGVLPINAITSLLGVPIVIWIIVRNHKFSSLM